MVSEVKKKENNHLKLMKAHNNNIIISDKELGDKFTKYKM